MLRLLLLRQYRSDREDEVRTLLDVLGLLDAFAYLLRVLQAGFGHEGFVQAWAEEGIA